MDWYHGIVNMDLGWIGWAWQVDKLPGWNVLTKHWLMTLLTKSSNKNLVRCSRKSFWFQNNTWKQKNMLLGECPKIGWQNMITGKNAKAFFFKIDPEGWRCSVHGLEWIIRGVEMDHSGVEMHCRGVEMYRPGVEIDHPGVKMDHLGVDLDHPGVEWY